MEQQPTFRQVQAAQNANKHDPDIGRCHVSNTDKKVRRISKEERHNSPADIMLAKLVIGDER
jgi:hypothetical protein